MSVYAVGNAHITAMLQALSPRYPGDGAFYYWNGLNHPVGGNIHRIAQKLVDENYRSVNYRYGEETQVPKFVYDGKVHAKSPVEIIKACRCYDYQTCETPDWEESEAYAIVRLIESRAINSLPGYDDAEWNITSPCTSGTTIINVSDVFLVTPAH